jgi:zinc-binding in reverse transcriptase
MPQGNLVYTFSICGLIMGVSLIKTIKISLKIQIFLWLVRHIRVLTKISLIKRWRQGSAQCVLCQEDEITDHLFILCPFVQCIWS